MTSAQQPSRRQIVTIVAGVLMTVIMSALDQSAVVTALPAIARELHGLEHLSWTISAYLLTSTALTFVYGKLSDLYGRRGLMLFAIALFVGASLLCALAQNVMQLIAARALQGAGAGGTIVLTQAMMADLVSPRERARYAVYVTSTFALTSAAGPLVGGFLVDHLTWRWIFWLNLPVGIVAFLLASRFVDLHLRVARGALDYVGLTLLTASVAMLLLLASWGGTVYPWVSPQIVASLVAALLLFAAFALRELRAAEPIFPPRLFANSIVRHCCTTVFVIALLMFGGIVLIPVFLQLVAGSGAGSSGAQLIPMLVGMPLASTCASQFMRRTGRYKVILPIGLSLATIAFALLSTMNATTSTGFVLAAVFLLGLSLGGCIPTISVAVQNAVDPRDLGIAISTVAFARWLGGAFGAAIFWSLLRGFAGASLEAAAPAALAVAFRDVFLVAAGIAAVTMLTSLRLREEPLKTTRPSERVPVATET